MHDPILPITSAHNPRNIYPQFTRLNIRTSAAPHIRILAEVSDSCARWINIYSVIAKGTGPQDRTGPQGRSRRGRDPQAAL